MSHPDSYFEPKKSKQVNPKVNFSGFLNYYVDAETKKLVKANPLSDAERFIGLLSIIEEGWSITLKTSDDGIAYQCSMQDRDISSPTAGRIITQRAKDIGRLCDLVIYLHAEIFHGDYSSLLVSSSREEDF